MYDDAVLLTPSQVEAAASKRQLARLVERLVGERSWPSLGLLFSHASGPSVPLDELVAAARAAHEALAALPEARSGRATINRELRGLRAVAAGAVARRLVRDPLTEAERGALAAAAEIYLTAEEPREAARLYERVGDDERAAATWELVGDVDHLEAALERLDARRRERLAAAEAVRRFETFLASGERAAALAAWRALGGTPEAASLAPLAADVERRLRRGRAITLRDDDGRVRRFAGAPATLGREPGVELPLRDPGVSRRHATIAAADPSSARLHVEDAGSRGGTWTDAGRIAGRLPFDGEGELRLGERARLAHRSVDGTGIVEVRGLGGLDRDLHAFVGAGPLPVELAFPGARGLVVRFDGGVPRFGRAPSLAVRLGDHLVGDSWDVLRDDVLELPGLRLVVL